MRTAPTRIAARIAATVAAALLAVGCAGVDGSASPVNSQATATVGTSSAGTEPITTDGISTAPDLAIDRTPGAELITVVRWDATIAGVSGQSTIRLDGDGLIVRSSTDGDLTQARIEDQSVEQLAWRVLEIKDLDTGPMVTDVGGISITLRLGGQEVVQLTLSELPAAVGQLTPEQQQNRDSILELVAQLSSLDGLHVVEAPTTLTGPSTGPGTPGTTTAGSTPATPTEFEFDTSGDTPVITTSFNDYGEGGVVGVDTATVFGNGRVVRSRPDGVITETLDIGPLGVRDLLVRAGELGLLDSPDYSGLGAEDAGTGKIELRFNDRVVELLLDGPYIAGDDERPQTQLRTAFGAFLAETLTLSGVEIIDGPTANIPEELQIRADPDSDDSEPIDWPLSRPASEVFAGDSTVTVTGQDVRTLVELLADQSNPERRNGEVAVQVSTGEESPEQLTLWIAAVPA